MHVSPEYLDFIMDKLAPLGDVTSRILFGGYGIFHLGLMFGLLADDTLYFKINESNRDRYVKAGSRPFPHLIRYYEVPTDVLEDDAKLHEWAGISIAVAEEAASKKRK